MSPRNRVTQSRLKEVLGYDPESGQFIWLETRGTRAAGAVAGHKRPDGYRYIGIDKVHYRATRLIWLYMFGHWPKHHVDHINRDTSDDRLQNLRSATRSQNLGNRKINKNNRCGFKGVAKYNKKYGAYINKDGKRFWLGVYDTPEQAHAAYISKAVELFGEFARAA